jgi:sigma-B regulation protein RsbU (phosphoserine phosphatase)
LYSEDAVTVSPVAGEVAGIDEIRRWWERIFSLFPDWTVRTHDLLVDGDRLAFFGTAGATDYNGWFGQPPTGEPFEYRAIIVLTVAGGKIVRDERIYDLSGLLQRLEKARQDRELKLAAAVQRALLPRTSHATEYGEAVGDSLPCRAIGGDFFETTLLPSGDLAIVLGDVSGKGPSAALVAAWIQGMLAVQFQTDPAPPVALAQLNRQMLSRHVDSRFATLIYGVLSPDGRFACCNAGHNPAIVLTKGGIRRIDSGGPVLGVLAESDFEQETVVLDESDTIVMFSDGVVEARDADGCEFGDERLLAAVNSGRGLPASDLLQSILESVQQHSEGSPQEDDITVLVTRLRRLRRPELSRLTEM